MPKMSKMKYDFHVGNLYSEGADEWVVEAWDETESVQYWTAAFNGLEAECRAQDYLAWLRRQR
jgi:hypothetical protein